MIPSPFSSFGSLAGDPLQTLVDPAAGLVGGATLGGVPT